MCRHGTASHCTRVRRSKTFFVTRRTRLSYSLPETPAVQGALDHEHIVRSTKVIVTGVSIRAILNDTSLKVFPKCTFDVGNVQFAPTLFSVGACANNILSDEFILMPDNTILIEPTRTYISIVLYDFWSSLAMNLMCWNFKRFKKYTKAAFHEKLMNKTGEFAKRKSFKSGELE